MFHCITESQIFLIESKSDYEVSYWINLLSSSNLLPITLRWFEDVAFLNPALRWIISFFKVYKLWTVIWTNIAIAPLISMSFLVNSSRAFLAYSSRSAASSWRASRSPDGGSHFFIKLSIASLLKSLRDWMYSYWMSATLPLSSYFESIKALSNGFTTS